MKTHGSLDLVPLARNFTDRISPWTRQSAFLGTVDPKLCLRGDAEAVGTCNKHTCPGETVLEEVIRVSPYYKRSKSTQTSKAGL